VLLRIDDLAWDEVNVEHIARHGVSPDEVEDVCYGFHFCRKEKGQRYILGGKTAGGKYLDIVVEKTGEFVFRPITAFEMSENYKASYRRRMG